LKWNWSYWTPRAFSTRLFLTEAQDNVTADAITGVPSKWTSEELDRDVLEKALQELHDVIMALSGKDDEDE
jgi:hypoxia up-regulated 1